MDVYLVPVGAERYELYCEVPDEPTEVSAEAPRGFFRRLVDRFKETLADAERARRHGHTEDADGTWVSRVKGRLMRWVAESIAEQRLLWHLRRQTDATLHYPSDLDEPTAIRLLRSQLGRDFDKHRFWLVIDSLLFIASGLLMLVPGPNVLAYYFAFRLVGHYLSLRGARQGLNVVTWRHVGSAPLAELRRAIALEPEQREQQVHDVAARLRLEHLATFFLRMTVDVAGH